MPAKITLTAEQLESIKVQRLDGLSFRVIAKNINISRHLVEKALKQLNLDSKLIFKNQIERECVICKNIKCSSLYLKNKKYCIQCKQKYGIKACERCVRHNFDFNYIENNIKEKKKRKQQRCSQWRKEKFNSDPSFKLRCLISVAINNNLKKNNKSINFFLPYSIQELKHHLESQFESWMNWNNWGKYDSKTWNDNDSSTWTWQIDHIISKANFSYNCVEEDSFKQCWALNNLRPLSAKINILDGNRQKNIKNSNK
jgi:hypothetical protein